MQQALLSLLIAALSVLLSAADSGARSLQSLQTLADNTAGGTSLASSSSFHGVSATAFVAVVLARPNDAAFSSANYTWGSAKVAFAKTNTGEKISPQ